jgi:hypothetical protein
VTNIDKRRVATVRRLGGLGYSYQGREWGAARSRGPQSLLMTAVSDAMHEALRRRADALEGCTEGSDEEAELRAIVHAIGLRSGPRLAKSAETKGRPSFRSLVPCRSAEVRTI